MKQFFTVRRICRAGAIAALYVALTCSFGMLSFVGLFQFRPAEALCILPLFFPEAVPALFVGCMLSNVISQYGIADIFLGSFVTLIAAALTWLVGKFIREENAKTPAHFARIALGGLFPILLNALIIPIVIVYIGGFTDSFETAQIAYLWNFVSLLVSQSVWIYALGTPLYFFVARMRKRGVTVFLDQKQRISTQA